MKLNDEEQDILAGKSGPVALRALHHQLKVGEFFGAEDFVPVTQAHIMADTESLGEAGLRFLESLAAMPEAERRVRVPTLTDPRGLDVAVYKRLGQTEAMVALGDEAPRRCGPGTVIRIPPGLAHEVATLGDEALECLVLYAPPLGPHGFVEAPRR